MEPILVGVLPCLGCGCRVISVTSNYCCEACEDGHDHDPECLRMPLSGTEAEGDHIFSSQLQKLIEQKGPQHLGSLPHVWDAEYGSGSWVTSRPVKSASKACNSYTSGVKLLGQVVHRLQEPKEMTEEEQVLLEGDLRHYQSLAAEVLDVLADEFDVLELSYKVTTSIAKVRAAPIDEKGGRIWCCELSLRQVSEALAEEAEEAEEESSEELHHSTGYGRTAEQALSMARLHILQELERWDPRELSRARKLEKQLQDDALKLLSEEASPRNSQALEELLEILVALLMKPKPRSFITWRLLARSWPWILTFADEEVLQELSTAMRRCSRGPSLHLWLQMAEAAAYECHRPILEMFEDVPLQDQQLRAVVYCRHQLRNLLLEMREQIRQELARSRSQRVSLSWGLGQAGFTCSLQDSIKGKVDAVALQAEDVTFLCEATDETRFVVRAVDFQTREALHLALQQKRLTCQPLAVYATIAQRQRDAVKNLLGRKVAFCPILRGAIIESWGDAQEVQTSAELLGSAERWEPPEEMKQRLSRTQQEAMDNAMSRRCSLVRGPPGTGKTHIAASVAMASAESCPEERVLCVTQSHAAAANLHRRLESFGVAAARVGTTLSPTEVVEQQAFLKVKKRWGEEDEEVNLLEIASEAGDTTGERSKELQKCQFALMRRMVAMSHVVVLTLASSGNPGLLNNMNLHMLVIDEAAQLVEPAPWVPLTWGCKRICLVGDEKQLPATILNHVARENGLGISLFERLVRDGIVAKGRGFVQLDEQQRMHPSIAEFPSHRFYEGTLTNGCSTFERERIPGFPWPNASFHVAFVECEAMAGKEGGRSHENPAEAEALLKVLESCLRAGLQPHQVGVITGYSAQQELLQKRLAQLCPVLGCSAEDLRVDTVDGFQGAERDLILASTVRSWFEVGFMRDPRRVNVMLTRARRGLIVFGNSATLQTEAETWKPWMDWVQRRNLRMPVEMLQSLGAPPTQQRAVFVELNGRNVECDSCTVRDLLAEAESKLKVPLVQLVAKGRTLSGEEVLSPGDWVKAEEWQEFVDPKTGKTWLWNEVTGESRWKK